MSSKSSPCSSIYCRETIRLPFFRLLIAWASRNVVLENFEIINITDNSIDRLIDESILILRDRPVLNAQLSSFPLVLFLFGFLHAFVDFMFSTCFDFLSLTLLIDIFPHTLVVFALYCILLVTWHLLFVQQFCFSLRPWTHEVSCCCIRE